MLVDAITDYLVTQDPDKPHSIITRILVSGIIVLAIAVLNMFYGLMWTVGAYLVCEWFGLAARWAFIPLGIAGLVSLWQVLKALADYWLNYGH